MKNEEFFVRSSFDRLGCSIGKIVIVSVRISRWVFRGDVFKMTIQQGRSTKGRNPKRRNFSSFTLDNALREASVKKLRPWELEPLKVEPSSFFSMAIERLQQFDTRSNERGRELVIDAIFAESIISFKNLKIWKGAPLETEDLNGNADYLITENQDYLETPYLCAVEAKKDDFEKGLAQCLVEMKACWLNNRDAGREVEVLGIVTNGTGWKFYRWAAIGEVYETSMYGEHEMPVLLGALNQVLAMCNRYLD
jgi:hypothetical protein